MIECKNITKIYRRGDMETVALRDISLSIKKGDFIAIMGASGSGKSTLMHILGALDTPTSGSYFLEGNDIAKLGDDELAEIRKHRIGFVFQAFNLLARASALRNVMLPLVYAGIAREKRQELAVRAMEAVGLPKDRFFHTPSELSGGQMQRVAIARALVNDPAIILADEPTGNLDSKTGEIVLGTFQRLHEKQERTIVLITHERYIAEHAQRIIKLRDGEIIDNSNHSQRRVNYE